MRGIGNHTPPDMMLRIPTDNTSVYVLEQVRISRDVPDTIHTESAREIAAWWQGPTSDAYLFTVFASTGAIEPELIRAIRAESANHADTSEEWEALDALESYVCASLNTVTTVAATARRVWDGLYRVSRYRDADRVWKITLHSADGPTHFVRDGLAYCHASHGCNI